MTPAKFKIDTSESISTAPKKVKRRSASSKKANSKSAASAAASALGFKDELKGELKDEPESVKREVAIKDEVIVKSERIDLESDRSTKAEPVAEVSKRTLRQQKLNKIKAEKVMKEES